MKQISWLTILSVSIVIGMISVYMRGRFDQVSSTGEFFMTVLPFSIGFIASFVIIPLIIAFVIKLISIILRANIDKEGFWLMFKYLWIFYSVSMLIVALLDN